MLPIMKNYSANDLIAIKSLISEKTSIIQQMIAWVEQNLQFEDRSTTLLSLKNSLNVIGKINKGIDSKPVMAVFGASQVGKSYLIKNLLSEHGQPFLISDGRDHYDFLKDINPPGTGAESTGVVTRFTIDQTIKFEGFPIKVILLSAKDVLSIVLDSFFLDLKRITAFIGKKELEQHLKKLEERSGEPVQGFLTEFDVLEIKEYFQQHLSKHTILFEGLYELRFFERIGNVITSYHPSEWNDLFSVLWNRDEHLSTLFKSLIQQLENIKFATKGYLAFDNVLRGHGEILDVKRLQELSFCEKRTLLKLEDGSLIDINISFLTAIIAELVFTIPKELSDTKAFLKYSDLLDFPGARSRMALDQQDISEKNIDAMLLRGKVSYLFNKYSDDFNINNLLFCTNDKQLEVNEISTLLSDWIGNNIGKDVQERSKSLKQSEVPPLFVIFTFFNNQLKFDSTNDFEFQLSPDKLAYKWHTRFERFFENEIVTQTRDWHTDWTYNTVNFNNFYLLRDYKYSEDSFAGFEEFGEEKAVNPDRKEFLNSLKDSFSDFGFVKKHFKDPLAIWEASASLNQDGSQRIIDNLSLVSNNKTKINHYLQRLDTIIKEISDLLTKYVQSDDVAALRANNNVQVSGFQFSFNQVLAKDLSAFNVFLKHLSIDSLKIYHLLNDHMVTNVRENDAVDPQSTAASIFRSQYAELGSASSKEDVIRILKMKLWLPTDDAVIHFLNSNNIKLEDLFVSQKTETKAEYYTRLVLDYWLEQILNLERFNFFYELGLTKGNVQFLIDHLKLILDKRKISAKLINILNDVVSQIQLNHGHEVFLSETFSLIINDLVFGFDLSYFSDEEQNEAEGMRSHLTFYQHIKDISSPTIAKLFDNTSLDIRSITLEKYNKWIEFFRISLAINAGSINYDEEANQELSSLIHQFSSFQLK